MPRESPTRQTSASAQQVVLTRDRAKARQSTSHRRRHQHVGPQLARIGLGIVLGELGRRVDGARGRARRSLSTRLRSTSPPSSSRLRTCSIGSRVSRILSTSSRWRYFAGSRHRVAAIAVGEHLENVRPVAIAHPLRDAVTDRLHRAHVHAVDTARRGYRTSAPRCEKSVVAAARVDRGAHGIAVVLDDEDHRQLPELRHVEGFVDLALVGRAIAEVGEADLDRCRDTCWRTQDRRRAARWRRRCRGRRRTPSPC